MKSTAGLFIRILGEENYAKEVENIRFSLFIRNRNHDRRKRVKHIARPPVYAAH